MIANYTHALFHHITKGGIFKLQVIFKRNKTSMTLIKNKRNPR